MNIYKCLILKMVCVWREMKQGDFSKGADGTGHSFYKIDY